MQIKLLVALLAVAIVGGGAYYYTQMSLTDEEAVVRAMQNTAELDTYSTQVIFGATAFDGEEEVASISLLANADVDDVRNATEGSGILDVDYQMGGMEMRFSLEGGFMLVDDNFYGKLETFPTPLLGFLPAIQADVVSELTGRWILLAEGVQEEIEEELDMREEEVEEEVEKLLIAFWEKELLLLGEKERDEINGVSVDKYLVSFDPEKMPEFLEEDFIPFMEFFGEVLEMSQEELDEVLSMIAEAKIEFEDEENLEEMERILEMMELHIWTDGEYIYRIRAEIDVDVSDEDIDLDELPEVSRVVFFFEVNYDNFNEEFDITAPSEYLTTEEVMEIFMQTPIPHSGEYELTPEEMEMMEELGL